MPRAKQHGLTVGESKRLRDLLSKAGLEAGNLRISVAKLTKGEISRIEGVLSTGQVAVLVRKRKQVRVFTWNGYQTMIQTGKKRATDMHFNGKRAK